MWNQKKIDRISETILMVFLDWILPEILLMSVELSEKTFECWKLMRTPHGERRSLLLQWEESRWNSAPSFCELETPDCPLRRLKPAFFPALSQAASVLHVIESLSCWSSSRCRDRRCSSEGTVIISFAIPCLLS